MNPLYSAMGGQSMMTMLQQFKANPMQFLMQRGMNVPQGVSDPGAIMNHLLQTGQINQNQVNAAYQMAQRFR